MVGVILLLYTIVYFYVSANKKSIIKQVTTEISKRMNGNVSIRDVELSFFTNFPKISVVLHNIVIRDTMYEKHRHTFFEADKVFVRVGFWKMVKKQSSLTGLRIEDGTMYLFTDTSGFTNKYLFDMKSDTAKAGTKKGNNELKNIELKNVRFIIEDLQKEKLHNLLVNKLDADIKEDNDSTLNVDIDNNMFVNSLAFNLPRGSYLKEKSFAGKFLLRYDKGNKQIQFDSIDVNIAKHPFNLTGRFDLAEVAGRKPQFSFTVHTKNVEYEFAKKLLTQKIDSALSIMSATNKLDISASIIGPIRGGEPLIRAWWTARHSDVKSPLVEFDDCSFTGSYINEVVPGLPRKDPNSKIEIETFTGKWQGLPITSEKIIINDLNKPTLICDIKSSFPLTTLNDFLNSAAITLSGGQASVDISYKGPLAKNRTYNSFVNGAITIKNGTADYNPRSIPLKNVNGKILFQNSDVLVKNLSCQVLNNNIIMEGSAKNALSLVNTEPNKVILDWSIYSPSLNLGSFTSLLQQRKKVVTTKKGLGNKLESTARKLDAVLESGSINLSLKADKLLYKKFDATDVTAYVTILQNSWQLQKVNLNHAGGHMNITGSLEDKSANYHLAKVNVELENVDVSKTFAAFSNFGQDGITSESIRGKLTSEINASLALDDSGKVYPSSMDGVVNFSLKDGALIDYEPVKKLQIFLFKKRDFANIQFAELKNTLEIKNQEVKISRMEIQSSVLSMFVEGIFSMKKTTDITIQVPLSNLKKRGASYTPENVGTDRKGGPSIYIRGTPGEDGNVKFKYDLFHKFRKDK